MCTGNLQNKQSLPLKTIALSANESAGICVKHSFVKNLQWLPSKTFSNCSVWVTQQLLCENTSGTMVLPEVKEELGGEVKMEMMDVPGLQLTFFNTKTSL